jgi:predicted RNA-binding Zn ribbon-like protein
MGSIRYATIMPVAEPTFSVDAGRLSLDFLATLSNRGSDAAVERWPVTASLGEWLMAAGLGPVAGVVRASDLATARRLREAITATVYAAMSGGSASTEGVGVVNRAAEPALRAPRLVFEDGRFVSHRPALNVTEALSLVARDAIDLVASSEVSLLRECEAHDCTGLYVDASRGRRRRWCSAARCGNRARVAAHRARARGSSSGA